MDKRDYIVVAKAINSIPYKSAREIATEQLIDAFRKEFANFNVTLFRNACMENWQ